MHYLHERQDRGTDRWVLKTNRRFVDRKEDKMFTQLRKAARALRPATAAEREIAYLNEATDRIDLEYRQRAVDRGMFRNAGF